MIAPEVISVKRLIKVFDDIDKNNSETQICFVLGAGASKSSGIRTGEELARIWYEELKEIYSKIELTELLKQYKIDKSHPEQYYSELYALRYRDEPLLGFDFINKEMDNKQPSYGYTVLSQLLTTTQHNVVITTNFDNLIELSVYVYSSSQPLICGHESLAKYARPSMKRPLIAKIHRSREFNPNSAPEQVKELVGEWVQPLNEILNNRIIVCIGYGGNDGSLMGFFEKITNVRGIYWCIKDRELPNRRVQELLKKLNGKIVQTDGFDEFMFELQDKLRLELLNGQIIEVAKDRSEKYIAKVDEIRERNKEAKDPDKQKAADNISKKTESNNNWVHYVFLARDAKSNEDKEKIYNIAIKKFPNEPEIIYHYAWLLSDIKKYKEAETQFRKAIGMRPDNDHYLNAYALLLFQVFHRYDDAEEYLLNAIKLAPNKATYFNNYAKLLETCKGDLYKAEEYYLKSLQLERESFALSNYGGLLCLQNKFDIADNLFEEAIKNQPKDQKQILKAWFYRFLFFPKHRGNALRRINILTKQGARCTNSNFSLHIDHAIKLGFVKTEKAHELLKLITE